MTSEKRYRPTTLRDYLRIIFRRRWLIVLPLLLVGLASIPICVFTPPRYVARTKISRKDLNIATGAVAGVVSPGRTSSSLRILREEILAWPRVDKVVSRLKMDVGLKTDADRQRLIRDLQKRINIRSRAHSRGVDIVEVSARGADPARVTDIANAISDVYIERTMSAGEEEIRKSITYLKTQVATHKALFNKAEDEMAVFQKQHRTEIPIIKQRYLDRILSAETRKIASGFSLQSAEVRLAKIKEQLEETAIMIQGGGVMRRNPEYARLTKLVAQLEQRERSMARVMTPKHPDLVRVRARLAETKQELKDAPLLIKGDLQEVINPLYVQLVKDRARTEQEISAHRASVKSALGAIRANEYLLKTLASDEKRYTELARAVNEASKLHGSYRAKLVGMQERLKHESASMRTVVEVIAKARVPRIPDGPNKLKIVLTCLMAGVALSTGLTFCIEFFDYSLRSSEDAVNALGIPMLGTITLIRTQPERLAKRRWRFGAGMALLVFMVTGIIAALVFERFYPGSLSSAWDRILIVVNWAAAHLGSAF